MQGERMQETISWMQSARDARAAIQTATEYLVARRNYSPQKALDWIQQEAMAKRAALETVAVAIVSGESVPYRHSVPIDFAPGDSRFQAGEEWRFLPS